MIHCVWRICFEILPGFLEHLMQRKFRSKWGDMLFPNEKRMNLKVLVSLILDLWKRVQMCLGHELIEKRQSHQGTQC